METELSFLAPVHSALIRMATGVRIVLGLDPEPSADQNPGTIHPVAQARQDAFHFNIPLPYPDETGQTVKAGLEAFLAGLRPHPTLDGCFVIERDGASIRIEVTNMVRYNAKRIWLLNGKIMEGRYEDMKGVRIRAWGLDEHAASKGSSTKEEI